MCIRKLNELLLCLNTLTLFTTYLLLNVNNVSKVIFIPLRFV